MPITPLTCPACGAPLTPSKATTVACAYCGHYLLGVADASWEALLARAAADEDGVDDSADRRPWCRVAGRKLVVHGLLARGERSDVFLGRTARRPTELVVVKAWRGEPSDDVFSCEHRALARLGGSQVRGAELMTTLVPQPLVRGPLVDAAGATCPALVYRWRSGYQHTLADVRAAYPDGVDGQTAVWMCRRLLDLLAWVHRNGIGHGRPTPRHVLVHPRDHGAVLVGWSGARAFVADGRDERRADLREAARSILFVLRATPDAPSPHHVPEPLHALLSKVAEDGADDASALSAAVLDRATAVYGPPTFHRFTMPGWS
jgi:hypothetical protein